MRDRVFGIETEYALIYHPARGETGRPTNLALYRRFEAALVRRVRTLPNAFSHLRDKLGRFLENGGTFHYEATALDFEHGLIEMASPECRDPYTLVCHERAKDELLESLAAEVNDDLRLSGYQGEVRIGKNNVDSQGHTFGSHESYWVEDRLGPLPRLGFAALWPVLWALSLPFLAFAVGVRLALLVGFWLFGRALLITGLALGAVPAGDTRRVYAWAGSALRRAYRRMHRLALRLESEPSLLARPLQRLMAPLYAVIAVHSRVYNAFHYRRFRADLTAFLVTRTVYAGAGAVAFDGGPLLRLAQRPPFLRSVSRIFPDGDLRPIYETRDLFFRPWSSLRSRRRLHLMLGDSNLCEWALALRVGATALALEAVESGSIRDWPRLAAPLRALERLNRDTGLREPLELADGTTATALEIQRRYLDGVRRALADADPVPLWKARALRDWEEALRLLERDPGALADRVDWIAKRKLIDELAPDRRDRAALERRGAEVMGDGGALTAADRRLRRLGYAVRRADLRYHELGLRGGYRRLEARGAVRRISAPADVDRARREAPRDTRARARGAAIALAHAQAASGGAAWHRVRIGKLDWRWFHDPLDPGPPS